MIWALKLKITICGTEQTFEKGKNNIKSINIDNDAGWVIIEFEEGFKWDYRSINIQNVEIMDYKIETFKRKLSYGETYRRTC